MQYCPKCGARNEDGITQCAGCGASFSQLSSGQQAPQGPQGTQIPQDTGYRPPKPNNNLIWAILSTILCCLPAGIVSIVFAAKVDSQYYAGDYAGAQDSANKARIWAIVSAVVAVAAYVIYGIIIFAVGISGVQR